MYMITHTVLKGHWWSTCPGETQSWSSWGRENCRVPILWIRTKQVRDLTRHWCTRQLIIKMLTIEEYLPVNDIIWKLSEACVLSVAYLRKTSDNLFLHISRMLGRHYQDTKGHPRSWAITSTFIIDYNPNGRHQFDNTIKAKIIKQIGGSGLR